MKLTALFTCARAGLVVGRPPTPTWKTNGLFAVADPNGIGSLVYKYSKLQKHRKIAKVAKIAKCHRLPHPACSCPPEPPHVKLTVYFSNRSPPWDWVFGMQAPQNAKTSRNRKSRKNRKDRKVPQASSSCLLLPS